MQCKQLPQSNGLFGHTNLVEFTITNGKSIGLLPPANEVWGKVIFLHLFHSVHRGGVPDQVPPLGPGTPPQTRYTPQDQVHPPGPGTPPWTRYTPQDQVHPPRDQVHPPRLIQIFLIQIFFNSNFS